MSKYLLTTEDLIRRSDEWAHYASVSYWCNEQTILEGEERDYDVFKDEDGTWVLTDRKIARGFHLLIRDYPHILSRLLSGCGGYDDMNLFVQLSLFGTEKYP